MNSPDARPPTPDPLEALFARARTEPPPELLARILAQASDPAAARRLYRSDVAQAARRALVPVLSALAAGLLLSLGCGLPQRAQLDAGASLSRGGAPTAPASPLVGRADELDSAAWLFGLEDDR